MKEFQGYVRANGSVGIRNHTLILSATRAAHVLAAHVGKVVAGTKCFIPGDEDGRSRQDRETIARVMVGLGLNPNVGAVLVVSNKKHGGYAEFNPYRLAEEIGKSGKPVEVLILEDEGGFYNALGEGLKKARRLVFESSRVKRSSAEFGRLALGVKCGISDATSGIAGNPAVGYVVDRLIEQGGTAFFSETTEVIGAEHIVAERFESEREKMRFLEAVKRVEDEARETGEDIRTINPIPANIEAGLTTLEEKSLGAISKTGTKPIKGVLAYAERPQEPGLYFVDSWMSSTSLFLGYAASGASLIVFQMGGQGLPEHEPAVPSVATGFVSPIFYTTGNPRTYAKASHEMDFNAGGIITSGEKLDVVGSRLLERVLETASGTVTKAETLDYQDPVEIYLKGPCL